MTRRDVDRWMQNLHKGTLSRQLSIPEKENIPITLLRVIVHAPVGTVVKNPTKTGKKHYIVTDLMKKRANTAITLKTKVM